MAEEKTYLKNASCKEVHFQNGNSILKLGLKADEVCAQLQSMKNDKGYVNLGISARKEVGKYGDTHCVWLDTWKPEPKADVPRSSNPASKYAPDNAPEDSQLPF